VPDGTPTSSYNANDASKGHDHTFFVQLSRDVFADSPPLAKIAGDRGRSVGVVSDAILGHVDAVIASVEHGPIDASPDFLLTERGFVRGCVALFAMRVESAPRSLAGRVAVPEALVARTPFANRGRPGR